jgi:hypothetical protein
VELRRVGGVSSDELAAGQGGVLLAARLQDALGLLLGIAQVDDFQFRCLVHDELLQVGLTLVQPLAFRFGPGQGKGSRGAMAMKDRSAVTRSGGLQAISEDLPCAGPAQRSRRRYRCEGVAVRLNLGLRGAMPPPDRTTEAVL